LFEKKQLLYRRITSEREKYYTENKCAVGHMSLGKENTCWSAEKPVYCTDFPSEFFGRRPIFATIGTGLTALTAASAASLKIIFLTLYVRSGSVPELDLDPH
jgi:hypothetical protein